MKPVPGKSRSEAFSELLGQLRESSNYHDENARLGAIHAVNSVVEFLNAFEEVRDGKLAIPLINLSAALVDLDDGIRTPLLTQSFKKGRNPKSTSRQQLIGHIAFTRKILVSAGYKPEEAAIMIARRLNDIGIKNLGYGGQRAFISQHTVENWCEVIDRHNDDEASQTFMDLENTFQLKPGAPKAAVRKASLSALEDVALAMRSQDEGPQSFELNAE